MMRAPFQILAIPFRMATEPLFCVLRRSDSGQYQFIAGGGEDRESPEEAAKREIREETGLQPDRIISLTSMAYVPAEVISEKHRRFWPENTFVLPEYAFAFECAGDVRLSPEHLSFEWLCYADAMDRLTWDSNKTALYELYHRLTQICSV